MGYTEKNSWGNFTQLLSKVGTHGQVGEWQKFQIQLINLKLFNIIVILCDVTNFKEYITVRSISKTLRNNS